MKTATATTATATATATTTTIRPFSFGDKAGIARTLTTSGRELKASILESAILPILSNALCGHSTFRPLIAGRGHNTACPLQAALWAILHTRTGKPSTTAAARAVSAVFALALGKARDQASHDETVSEAIILISDALTPIKGELVEKPTKIDYAALYAGAQITIAELTARNAELTARYTELTARTPEPAAV